MQLNLGITTTDFFTKQAYNSNSTIDQESRHEEPYHYWEPNWMEISQNSQFTDVLNICPWCTKIVRLSQRRLVCEGPNGNLYLSHFQCSYEIYQFTEYTQTAKKVQIKDFSQQFTYKIGCKQYYVQITIQHPLTPNKVFSCSKKMFQFEKKLAFFVNQNKPFSMEPNHIVLPLRQFKCCIKISPLFSSQDRHSNLLYFKVNMMGYGAGTHIMKVKNGDAIFMGQFQIVEDQQRKKQIIENLNFKYKRPFLEESFVKLNKFTIQFIDNQAQYNPQSVKYSQNCSSKSPNQFSIESSVKFIPPARKEIQVNEVEVQIIDTSFINYIKTQAGSKQFQKKVNNYKHEQIEAIICKILPCLEEIILNDYANYMFQSLLGACTFQQRMRIITKVADILPKLVCQQQGTFVFQQLISFLTNKQQFQCICIPVCQNFKLISLDNYGNHFMRKLIQNMPKEMLSIFMPTVYKDFIEFAQNKNAVCVMKCVLRALKEGENLNNQIGQHMKKFLDMLNLNTQVLINDQYGNYLIQQAYEVVSAERLGGISEYIISFFGICSCQKFSNNVVFNCVKRYWGNNINIYKTLKQNIDNKSISLMYQNQLGNKILLEVMELSLEYGIKDKIAAVVRNEQPSKFNNRRWVGLSGKSKTGAVGTNYNSFSEAHSFMKRKHYN